jgi:hypothetical protein
MIFPKKLEIKNNVITIKYCSINEIDLNNSNFFDDADVKMCLPNKEYKNILTNPDYFIFHKSRCGSTLLCNMIKQCNDFIVFCEPKIFLECFALNIPINIKIDILKKIFISFCNECNKYNKKSVFKFTSYIIQYYELLDKLFKNTKNIYITRDTLEVIKSNVYKPSNNIRKNNLILVKDFPNFNNNCHILSSIFEMDNICSNCDNIINYDDIIKPNFIDKFSELFNINIHKDILLKILEQNKYYSKYENHKNTNKYENHKNINNGIELYDYSISKNFCSELINLIDNKSNNNQISIKKCKSFSLFDLTFWKYYDSKNKFPVQKNLNIQYNCIFLKLKSILYEKFFEYCKKNKYFTSHKLMYKTDNLKNDVLINTDIVSINFTKYEPIIHDCNVWHSENSFISLDESTRITAFIVYLNDVYKGGETEFYFQNLKIKPKIGRIALFSPDWMCTHKGNVSLDNSKYILTGWFHTKIHLNKTLFPFYTLKYDKIII